MGRRIATLTAVVLFGILSSGCSGDTGREPRQGATPAGGTGELEGSQVPGATAVAILSVKGMT